MRHARKVIAGAAVLAGAAALAGHLPLQAQVIRCYDVVCIKDKFGVLHCVEKLTTCPA